MTMNKDLQKMYFTAYQIDAAYINALVNLINACRAHGVEINTVKAFQGGFHVTFKGYDGADAICHDHSYGSPYYGYYGIAGKEKTNDWTMTNAAWEIIGFPWDGNDVSVHSAEELVDFIVRLNNGVKYNEDWE